MTGYEVSFGAAPRRSRGKGYILLISHMRSYSTLLAHILGGHPEIDGYSELHQHYESKHDLLAMTRRIEETTGRPRGGRYALDNLLHNKAFIHPEVLERSDMKVILLVRNPVEAIPSIVRMAGEQVPGTWITEPRNAVDYYINRLRRIDEYSERLGLRALFVESERIIDATADVLARLTRWLDLGTPLVPTYELNLLSGVAGRGDPSTNIRAGKVLRGDERDRGSQAPVDIPEDGMREAIAAHGALLGKMRARHTA